MIHVRSPARARNRYGLPTLFMAGGITGTIDWQVDFLKMLEGEELMVFNPRRLDFDASNKEMEVEQITWEHVHLVKADAISFWFTPETLCPITLFELGTVIDKSHPQRVFIGCHPEYKRLRDVEIQTRLRNPTIEVVQSLSELSEQVKDWARKANENGG